MELLPIPSIFPNWVVQKLRFMERKMLEYSHSPLFFNVRNRHFDFFNGPSSSARSTRRTTRKSSLRKQAKDAMPSFLTTVHLCCPVESLSLFKTTVGRTSALCVSSSLSLLKKLREIFLELPCYPPNPSSHGAVCLLPEKQAVPCFVGLNSEHMFRSSLELKAREGTWDFSLLSQGTSAEDLGFEETDGNKREQCQFCASVCPNTSFNT